MSNIPIINQKNALLEKPKKGVINSGFKNVIQLGIENEKKAGKL